MHLANLSYSVNTKQMSRSTRKPTLWNLRKVSTRISLSMPRRLTRTDTFRLLWIFCFRNYYSIPLFPWDEMCRPGLACADCACWSGSIYYAESILLVFLWNGSNLNKFHVWNMIVVKKTYQIRQCIHIAWAGIYLNINYSHSEKSSFYFATNICSTESKVFMTRRY